MLYDNIKKSYFPNMPMIITAFTDLSSDPHYYKLL